MITGTDIVSRTARDISGNRRLNEGIRVLRTREREFGDELELTLAGIAMVPDARATFDDRLDEEWSTSYTRTDMYAEEVVIGAGLQAAVYASVRELRGFPQPLILERGRVGGAFAVSQRASFFLNSRNRPGPLGLPGERRGLNCVPGGPIQPSRLSSREFETNADFAFAIRAALGRRGQVKTEADVVSVTRANSGFGTYAVELRNGAVVMCDRVIDARGLGDPIDRALADGRYIRTFPQHMALMDGLFPLEGLRRVAVVGGGDSGKCAVESFLGIGPSEHYSVAELDFIELIDWYAPDLPATCAEWRTSQRGRYQAIGSYLPFAAGEASRLRVLKAQGSVSRGYQAGVVNGRLYDCVIPATGNQVAQLPGVFEGDRQPFGNEPVLAMRYGPEEAYALGVRAEIPFSDAEETGRTGLVAANRVAAFRLVGRTAALATRLPLLNPPF
jgi:hypothetical protein